MIARREQLAMSQNKAAKLFGGSRTTWINWEKDAADPERYNYVLIETVLKWEPGSVKAIREGGEPIPLRDHSLPAPPPEGVDPAHWAVLTPEERNRLRPILDRAHKRLSDRQRGA